MTASVMLHGSPEAGGPRPGQGRPLALTRTQGVRAVRARDARSAPRSGTAPAAVSEGGRR